MRDEKAERDQLENDIDSVMSSAEGRRVMWWVMTAGNMFKTTFTGSSNTSFFNEGRRALALEVLQCIQRACPEKFAQAQEEQLRKGK